MLKTIFKILEDILNMYNFHLFRKKYINLISWSYFDIQNQRLVTIFMKVEIEIIASITTILSRMSCETLKN
jgi:hypothetical protein